MVIDGKYREKCGDESTPEDCQQGQICPLKRGLLIERYARNAQQGEQERARRGE